MSEKTTCKGLSESLIRKINDGILKSGDKLPNIRAMAKQEKCHYHTVRLAYKILKERNYVSSVRKGGTIVCTPKNNLKVFIILPYENSSTSIDIVRGIHEVLDGKCQLEVIDTHNDPKQEITALRRIDAENINGTILFSLMTPEASIEIMRHVANRKPIVLMDRFFVHFPTWNVISDNFQGGVLAATRLFEAGCKRIAVVALNQFSSTNDRLEGFKKILMEQGVATPPELIYFVTPEEINTSSPIERFLAMSQLPDGIFFFNDFQALMGMQKLLEKGVKIPHECKLIGFDDIEAASLCYPPLTTIRQDGIEIGRQSALLWLEQVALPPHERQKGRTIRIPVTLIERSTT